MIMHTKTTPRRTPSAVSASSGAEGAKSTGRAAKTAAGLAAGGLGAAIRYAPRKRRDPFAQAIQDDDPEPVMPADDPFPGPAVDGAAAPVSDEVLHLLYRSGVGVPRGESTVTSASPIPSEVIVSSTL